MTWTTHECWDCRKMTDVELIGDALPDSPTIFCVSCAMVRGMKRDIRAVVEAWDTWARGGHYLHNAINALRPWLKEEDEYNGKH